jgi:hypothetical protein
MPIALSPYGPKIYEENAMRDFLGPVDAAQLERIVTTREVTPVAQ